MNYSINYYGKFYTGAREEQQRKRAIANMNE